MSAVAYIGLGANVGNREANLRMALRGMTRMARVVAVSSLYESTAEPPDQPAYYNAVCAIETGLEPLPLLRFLKGLEHEIGRRRGGERWGPRPVDLDVLLYEDCVVESPELVIPHPRLAERAFVLVPLAEIAPDVRVPALDATAAALLKRRGQAGVSRVAEQGWDGVVGTDQEVRI